MSYVQNLECSEMCKRKKNLRHSDHGSSTEEESIHSDPGSSSDGEIDSPPSKILHSGDTGIPSSSM